MIVERLVYFLANGVFMGAQRPLYCMVVPSEFNVDVTASIGCGSSRRLRVGHPTRSLNSE